MKNLQAAFFGIILAILNTSCSTSTKTANTVDYATSVLSTGAVIATGDAAYVAGIPLRPGIRHQIEIKGIIICEGNPFQNFNSLSVELREIDKKVYQIKVDEKGEFNSLIKSSEGKHTLVLLQKRSNRILDQVEFISTDKKDRFEINLKSCKSE